MLDNPDLPPAPARRRGTLGKVEEFDLGVRAASVVVVRTGADLHGWCIAESTGAAAARVRIRDGQDISGPVLAPIALVANGTSVAMLGDDAIVADIGVFLEVVAGSVEATLYLQAPGVRPEG